MNVLLLFISIMLLGAADNPNGSNTPSFFLRQPVNPGVSSLADVGGYVKYGNGGAAGTFSQFSYDNGNNVTDGVFTAPSPGVYYFHTCVQLDPAGIGDQVTFSVQITFNGNTIIAAGSWRTSGGGPLSSCAQANIYLKRGDNVRTRASSGTAGGFVADGFTTFGGFKLP